MGANANAQAAELVAHWKLDENAGVTVGDSSASALHGLISGPGVSWAPGVFGSALYFDASGDFVSIPHSAALDFSTSFSLAFWIKGPPIQQGSGEGFATIINKAEGGANGFTGWAVYARAAEPGAISFSLGNGTSFSDPRLPGVLDNTWHHVAILVDHAPTRQIRLYRGGQLIASFSDSSTSVANNAGPLDFGLYRSNEGTAGSFEGQLDDIRLFAGALDDCAIAGVSNPNGAPDCDQNGISDYCQSDLFDCNHNCVPDTLDIANCPPEDLSCADCNANGKPDGCELLGNDCNENTVPDDCELSGNDCNGNGHPDECDALSPLNAKLTAADAAAGDYFGYSVAVSGDHAIVGAYGDDDTGSTSGSAYVFRNVAGNWQQVAKLTAADGAAGDSFGISVAVSGDHAIVGAYGDDDTGSASGSAYVFRNVAGIWQQVAKLTAADAAAGDSFGISVAVSGDHAIVGAYGDDDTGSASGSAYVFRNVAGNWQQVAKLTAADAAAGDYFGYSVAVSGDHAIVGAYADDDTGFDSGSAYVFRNVAGNWQQVAKLTAADAAAGDYFGYSVAVSGDHALVGVYAGDDTGSASASAYVFRNVAGNWQQVAQFTAADAAAGDYFGYSVAVSGDHAIVGALGDDDTGSASGSAYLSALPGMGDCDGNGQPDDCQLLPPGVRAVRPTSVVAVGSNFTGFGLHWGNAFGTLQSALAAAALDPSITQLWLASGTYRPDVGPVQNSGDRAATFSLRSNLAIYGGFACGDDELSDRDPLARPTILSGDLAGNDGPNFAGNGENSYHIVTAGPGVDATAVLDGVTIAGGVANGPGVAFRGGGLLCEGASPTISNCIFVGNYAGSGGAAYNQASSEAVYHRCVFSGNIAAGDGGAVVNEGGQTKYRSCLFSGNTSISGTGGAAYNVFSSVAYFSNCTISGNTALLGGGLGNNLASQAIVSNCILWNNEPSQIDLLTFNDTIVVTHSDIQGNWIGPGNTNSNPLFIDSDGADNVPGTLDDDFHIPLWSPCIDRGEPGYVPPAGATTDIDGEQRVLGCRVDMGADEVSLGAAHSGDVDGNGETETNDVSLFVNVLLNGSGNCAADVNNDGNVNGLDVAFFVQLLLAP